MNLSPSTMHDEIAQSYANFKARNVFLGFDRGSMAKVGNESHHTLNGFSDGKYRK